MKDRALLGLIYFPYFIVPVILLIDALFSSRYRTDNARARPVNAKSKKAR
jgi:hypothetical protein